MEVDFQLVPRNRRIKMKCKDWLVNSFWSIGWPDPNNDRNEAIKEHIDADELPYILAGDWNAKTGLVRRENRDMDIFLTFEPN